MRSGAYTSVSVLPDADTAMTVRVSEGPGKAPLAAIEIGDSGNGVTILVSDEQALNMLASVVGEARAKLVGAITRAKRAESEQSGQRELLAS